jgi:hypothetical protein
VQSTNDTNFFLERSEFVSDKEKMVNAERKKIILIK